MDTAYHLIPRTVCEYPLGLQIPAGNEVPVRARDDLDRHAPPLEYADGRVVWSGHASQDRRDAARNRAAANLARRRSDDSHDAHEIRAYAAAQREYEDAYEARACDAINRDHYLALTGRAQARMRWARLRLGRVPSARDRYRAGLCWYAHDSGDACGGCEA